MAQLLHQTKLWSLFQKCTRTLVKNSPKGMWDSPGSTEGRFQTRTGSGHSWFNETKLSSWGSRLDHEALLTQSENNDNREEDSLSSQMKDEDLESPDVADEQSQGTHELREPLMNSHQRQQWCWWISGNTTGAHQRPAPPCRPGQQPNSGAVRQSFP